MSTLRTKLLTAGFAVAATMGASSAMAQNIRPNVLIMTEDADKDTVPRNNRMMKRVYDEFNDAMMRKGFRVYNETAVSMDIVKPQGVRREDTELLTIAKSVRQPPIDIVVTYEIYAKVRKIDGSNEKRPMYRVMARLSARALNVRTGQVLGRWSSKNVEFSALPSSCGADRDCLLETVGEDLEGLTVDVAEPLADSLRMTFMDRGPVVGGSGGGVVGGPGPGPGPGPMAGGPGPRGPVGDGCAGIENEYAVNLEGFSAAEVTAIEEYLVSFRCYISHRPLGRSAGGRASYWYSTRSDDARINRNLRLMLEHMGVQGVVEFTSNRFRVRKIN